MRNGCVNLPKPMAQLDSQLADTQMVLVCINALTLSISASLLVSTVAAVEYRFICRGDR